MALYVSAKINSDNEVIETLIVDETDVRDDNNNLSDALATTFSNNITGSTGTWKLGGQWQEGTVPAFRKIEPGIGDLWHPTQEKWYHPRPSDTWILNEDTLDWETPVPKPNTTTKWFWNEETQSWDLPDQPFTVASSFDETDGDPDNENFEGRDA